MPLTSLGDNSILAGSYVVNMASPNKIAANIMTSIPNITYSIFMNTCFRQYDLIILCMDAAISFELVGVKFYPTNDAGAVEVV
jgi:hypothetical protein